MFPLLPAASSPMFFGIRPFLWFGVAGIRPFPWSENEDQRKVRNNSIRLGTNAPRHYCMTARSRPRRVRSNTATPSQRSDRNQIARVLTNMANNTTSSSATSISRMAAIRVPCCLCGTMTFPNKNANQQCATCLAQNKYDLKSELQKGPGGAPHPMIYQCRTCKRYQRTPTLYEACEPESPELLSICLKHLPALNNSNKYKAVVDNLMVVQRVMVHHPAMVHQEDVMVELYCAWKQCPDCCNHPTAIVQFRQRRNDQFQKGLSTLKQAIRSNASIRKNAQMFSNYLREVAPLKISTSQKEVVVSTNSHDNNTTANRKHTTITCEMVPLCAQDLVVVDKTTCKNNKLAGQLILILKVVKAVVHAISASPPRSKIGDSL
eukprot:scaffold4001_cov94-Cylindrotheca_fusiformis.AAC.12